MKKMLVPFVIGMLMLSSLSQAQVKPFRFGLKVAPNMGWISPDSDGYEKNGSELGFSWGFISDFAITENYYVGTGFNINYLNGKYSYPHQISTPDPANDTLFIDYTGTMMSKTKLQYIVLPLTLKMKTNKFDKLQAYGQIGFSLGFNIKAKAEESFSYKVNDKYMGNDDERDISDDVTLLKGALQLGGGIEYYIDNSTSLLVGITYSNGISNILKGYNTAEPDIKQKATANYIELNVGVIF
jgi:hypothetical protein